MLRAFLLLAALAVGLAACDSNDLPASCENQSLEVEIDTLATGNCCATVDPNDTVRLMYFGQLEDGTVFQERATDLRPISGYLPGFRQGVFGMEIGEERRITIPPRLGYNTLERTRLNAEGEQEVLIPSCSTLIFEVEVLDIQ